MTLQRSVPTYPRKNVRCCGVREPRVHIFLRCTCLCNVSVVTWPRRTGRYIASADFCEPEDGSDNGVSLPTSIRFLLDRVSKALSAITYQDSDQAFIVNLSFIVPIACEVARMGAIAAFGVGSQALDDAFPAFELRKSAKRPILLLLRQLKVVIRFQGIEYFWLLL